MQWLMLQQDQPDDYVIATGRQHSVREFVERAARRIGLPIRWRGSGVNETGVDDRGRVVVSIDAAYFRPAEVDSLVGDAAKAREKLSWQPRIDFAALVDEMADADLALANREKGAGERPASHGRD
jgi:GDPmannose 4,6-dehydratase